MPSKEMFYKDREGKKDDQRLHEDIIENKSADEVTRYISLEAGRTKGISEDSLALLYL